ncbi:MAG: hypothetical protein R2910_07520 [Gemmatimonadales bacterium]
MRSETARSTLVASMALVGAVINGAYGAHLLARFADASIDAVVREVLVSGITLELSWAALLLWAVRHPLRGRFLLPITGGALLLGNALHSYALVRFYGAGLGDATMNLTVGVGIASLFGLAYHFGGPSPVALVGGDSASR